MRKRIAFIMVTVCVLLITGCGDSKIMSEWYSLPDNPNWIADIEYYSLFLYVEGVTPYLEWKALEK